MDWNEYSTLAARTAPANQARKDRVINAALGICGELAEMADASRQGNREWIAQEAGDVCWYLALGGLTDFIPARPHEDLRIWADEAGVNSMLLRLLILAGNYADHVKKYTKQGHPWTDGPPHMVLSSIAADLYLLMFLHRLDWESILEHNIDKLRKRYPEGFSVERSVYRED
jgi:NTP pyrophosphatase (non-canonical NTP hydrolase)